MLPWVYSALRLIESLGYELDTDPLIKRDRILQISKRDKVIIKVSSYCEYAKRQIARESRNYDFITDRILDLKLNFPEKKRYIDNGFHNLIVLSYIDDKKKKFTNEEKKELFKFIIKELGKIKDDKIEEKGDFNFTASWKRMILNLLRERIITAESAKILLRFLHTMKNTINGTPSEIYHGDLHGSNIFYGDQIYLIDIDEMCIEKKHSNLAQIMNRQDFANRLCSLIGRDYYKTIKGIEGYSFMLGSFAGEIEKENNQIRFMRINELMKEICAKGDEAHRVIKRKIYAEILNEIVRKIT